VLLQQAVQRGLLRAVALVVGRRVIRRPLGPMLRGLPSCGSSDGSDRPLGGDEFKATDVAFGSVPTLGRLTASEAINVRTSVMGSHYSAVGASTPTGS